MWRVVVWMVLLWPFLGWGQGVQPQLLWDEVIDYPSYYNGNLQTPSSNCNGVITYNDRFIVSASGLPYSPTPNQLNENHSFFRCYDWQGNLLWEDTIAGNANYSKIYRASDTTFFVVTLYNHYRYDTGQYRGFQVRLYGTDGRLRWLRRYDQGYGDVWFDAVVRPTGRFIVFIYWGLSTTHTDAHYFNTDGTLTDLRDITSTTSGLPLYRIGGYPERYLSLLPPQGPSYQGYYYAVYYDSLFNEVGSHTLGYLSRSNSSLNLYPAPDGYFSFMQPGTDSLYTEISRFNGQGRLVWRKRLDNTRVYFPTLLADGGLIWARATFSCRHGYCTPDAGSTNATITRSGFERMDDTLGTVWTTNSVPANSDSIYHGVYGLATNPNDISSGLFVGQKTVYGYYDKNYGYIAYIQGLGQIFDPTVLRATAGPRAQEAALLAYPNPTKVSFAIKGQTKPGQLTLHDALGRQVRQTQLAPDGHITTDGLPTGVYVWRLVQADGKVKGGRIAVERYAD